MILMLMVVFSTWTLADQVVASLIRDGTGIALQPSPAMLSSVQSLNLGGSLHAAPLDSTELLLMYLVSHNREQSHLQGLDPRCLHGCKTVQLPEDPMWQSL